MIVTQEQIKAAMDEHVNNMYPPEDYHSAQWYIDNLYPEYSRQMIVELLKAMVKSGDAIKSERTYRAAKGERASDPKFYYKIVIK